MKKIISGNKYSNDHLIYEILVIIFTTLSVVDLAIASMVCKSWNLASRSPKLWKKLDLSILSLKGMNEPLRPFAWMDQYSSQKITQFLKYTSSLSGGTISCIIFNYNVYLRDMHLISIAERTPNLKRLVLPISGNISKIGIETALRSWRGLKSITITSMVHYINLFDAIEKYCTNIVCLKFTYCFEQDHAKSLVKYTPNLKVLSIRSMRVNMRGLCYVLNNLEHLKVVNLRHSIILDKFDDELRIYSIFDVLSRVNISCKIIVCQRRSCLRCKNENMRNSRRLSNGSLEEIWREDEIICLAH
ncbi:F-box/LRR-repeat protein At3g48880-like [Trifolium pratense]|uniref:F-box/LRR-repeat protein At3g48880-like n=1 Tax=Trifolium pratense TaxID=57577 RepID=UPI001E6904B1|nr:F-box/LRR-repeat protein At3g48880-like [Trifolium pratense]